MRLEINGAKLITQTNLQQMLQESWKILQINQLSEIKMIAKDKYLTRFNRAHLSTAE